MTTVALFSYHLAELPPWTAARALLRPPTPASTPGLRHVECMALMRLGAPVLSPARLQLWRTAMFAYWDDESAIDEFLADSELGRRLAGGWHVRIAFLRRWGSLAALPDLPRRDGEWRQDEPVVAVTLARLQFPQLPRFVRWGRPVERLVRDDPQTTIAHAAIRLPRTVSTFSISNSVETTEAMVHGRSTVADPERHVAAMQERTRKDFHHEFTTMRFRPRSEHGIWLGRSGLEP